MKFSMKKLAIVSATFLPTSTVVFGGGSMGGGGPPALENLQEMLMLQSSLDGGLFSDPTGKIGLLTRKALQPQLSISRIGSGMASQSLKFSEADFNTLSNQERIDAVGSQGQNLSFDVLASDSADAIVLKARRALMRESVEASKAP